MVTLQRLLAVHVLEALRAREHVRVAQGAAEAVLAEIEQCIAPRLSAIAPYLIAAHGESALGGFGDRDADEAVASMVTAVTERMMTSDHLDDIFAEDEELERVCLRAVRAVLRSYLDGKLRVENDAASEGSHTIALDGLGYLVATACARASDKVVQRVLRVAARRTGATLESFRPADRRAIFISRSRESALLAIEEAIAEEVARLVELGRVRMPSIERAIELPAELLGAAHADDAIVATAERFGRRTCSVVACRRAAPSSLHVSLTPMSAEGAQRTEALFADLCRRLHEAVELAANADRDAVPDSVARAVANDAAVKSPQPASTKRARSKRTSDPGSSRRAAASGRRGDGASTSRGARSSSRKRQAKR